VDTDSALRRAREAGLDLVEISATSSPPVCRIMDFGKWKYEQSKKDKVSRAKTKTMEMKEVRLGRSMKIDPHDIEIRLQQARKFLFEGHKVLIVQNFKGREVAHRQRGEQRLQEIITRLADIARVEMLPRMAGRRMSIILSPDKVKIDQFKRREASAKPAGKSDAPAPTGAAAPAPAAESVAASGAAAKPASKAAGSKGRSSAKAAKKPSAAALQPSGSTPA
jgi:translation initiation factor IF-3